MNMHAYIEAHRAAAGLGSNTVTRIVPRSWTAFRESGNPDELEYATFDKDTRAAQFMLDMSDRTDYRWYTYSGRGMFGAVTVAVNAGDTEEPEEHMVRAATEVDLRSDSMGRGRVLYV